MLEPQAYRRILLTKWYFVLVDDADFPWLSQWKWYATPMGSGCCYAARDVWTSGRRRTLSMHRAILDATKGALVDHINRNTLDNRRTNLRLCTSSQNHANSPARGGTSAFKGVHWLAANRKWRASIGFAGRQIKLGCFVTEEDAARAYDAAAVRHFGAFAYINFPLPAGISEGEAT